MERVLVIDENEAVCLIVSTCLRSAEYDVVCAAERKTIMSLLLGRRFDYVITDVCLRDIVVPEILQAVNQIQPWAGIVLMSGGATEPIELCPESSANVATLRKPFHLSELLAALKSVSTSSRGREEMAS